MTPVGKSLCISSHFLFPVQQCFGLRGLGRLKSAFRLVAAASMTMLLSMGCGAATQLHVASAMAPSHRQVCEKVVRSDTATFVGDCSRSSTFTTTPGCGICAAGVRVNAVTKEHHSRGFHVLAPSRCHGVDSEASGMPRNFVMNEEKNEMNSQGSSVLAGTLAGQLVGEPFVAPKEEYYENEYVAREAVLKYLESEKIYTIELESVALPPSVNVMEERITFLKKIGLSTKDINDYPLVVRCSVKKNLVPVLSYLEKLNVEARFLPDLVRKYPMVLNSCVTMDLELVVVFLLGIGIDRLNLGRVLTRFPEILGFKIEGTLSTSIAYLVSLAVNMREINVREEHVSQIVIQYADVLGLDIKHRLETKMGWLIKHTGVKREDIPRVLETLLQILAINIALAQSRVTFLKSEGFFVEDLGIVMTKCPQILALNIDEVLKPCLSFYVNIMKRPLSELVNYTFFFTYNLEKRIQP